MPSDYEVRCAQCTRRVPVDSDDLFTWNVSGESWVCDDCQRNHTPRI